MILDALMAPVTAPGMVTHVIVVAEAISVPAWDVCDTCDGPIVDSSRDRDAWGEGRTVADAELLLVIVMSDVGTTACPEHTCKTVSMCLEGYSRTYRVVEAWNDHGCWPSERCAG